MNTGSNNSITRTLLTQVIFNCLLTLHWKEAHAIRKSKRNLKELFILEVVSIFEKVTGKEICKFLDIPPSSMTEIAQIFSGEGLIESVSSKDGREKPWKLTPKGKECLEAHKCLLINSSEDITSGLESTEMVALNQLLEKISENQKRLLSDLFIAPLF